MKLERSRTTLTSYPGGSSGFTSSSRSSTESMTWTVFVPDCRRTVSSTVGSPFTAAVVSGSAMSSSIRATSRSWMACPSRSRTTMLPNSSTEVDPASRAQGHRRRTGFDASAGNLRVLGLQRPRHVRDGEVVGAQPVGVERDVHLAGASADDEGLADTAYAFQLAAQLLVRVLGDVADRFLR